jgi:aminoglycoside phosphotransferase (APT) family kinase protein
MEAFAGPGILDAEAAGRLEAFLDGLGLGDGNISLAPLGEGHSNLTYLLRRGDRRIVLRRPPEGPLAPSANDVVREAGLLQALYAASVPVPKTLGVCEDGSVIGAPFYLMAYMPGSVLVDQLPPGFERFEPAAIADALVDALVDFHAIDPTGPGLDRFGRRGGYLKRQLRRFGELLEHNATRHLPDLQTAARWLEQNLPESVDVTIVHGDYRLGNVMFAEPRGAAPELTAILDWELSTLGDPLADIGYCTAMWAGPDDPANPMLDLSQVTRGEGFPPREYLARRYAERTGRDLSCLRWYQVLAIWKSAIFLEGSYGRYLSGASADEYFASLDVGVEELGRLAVQLSGAA